MTTLAAALGLVWPIDRVVLEADPSGGDLAFRLRSPRGQYLDPARSVLDVAADAREGLSPGSLARYAEPTSLGVSVLKGRLSPEAFAPMARLWPQVAAEAHSWPGTVIADLGRLHPGNAAGPVAGQATAVLLVTRLGVEALYRLRERAGELAARLGQGHHGRSPLAVVVVCPPRDQRAAIRQVQQVLAVDGATSTVPVAGFVAEDARGVEALWSPDPSRRLMGSELIRSVRSLVDTLLGWWPQFHAGPPAQWSTPTPPAAPGGRHGGPAAHPADSVRGGAQ
ncbi:MAG TPA: hypothetical protein VGL39_24785 [Jatrophihabitantaceae bacterium]